MKYEYKVLKANSLISEDQLDELGEEGWLLLSVVSYEDAVVHQAYYFFFSRQIAN